MKLALICAPSEFETLDFLKLGYHLVLADRILIDDKYAAYYQNKAAEGNFMIVDNGAAENGESIPFNNVLEAANLVNADEVALPDVLKDREATTALHYDWYDKVPAINRMVIPQADSIMNWLACLEDMMDVFDFRTVGIPKHLDDYIGGRTSILEEITRRGWQEDLNFHLLGCHNAPLKEIRDVYKKFPWVRGIDTAAPFAYAQANQSVGFTRHLSYNWHKVVENQSLALRNALDLKQACWGM